MRSLRRSSGAAVLLVFAGALLVLRPSSWPDITRQSTAVLLPPFPHEKLPVRRFVYYKLHKTGSEATIKYLHITDYCKLKRLCCLTRAEYHDAVNHCKPASYVPQRVKQSHSDCDVQHRETHVQLQQSAGFSIPMMRHCSPTMYNYTQENGVDAVAAHYRLVNPDNKAFLEQHGMFDEGVFHFTVIRHPVTQFISYWGMMSSIVRSETKKFENGTAVRSQLMFRLWTLDTFEKTVEKFYQKTMNPESVILDDGTDYQFRVMTNSQAKELGWDAFTQESLEDTIEFSKTLHFIGLQEHLTDSWFSLHKRLGWSRRYKPDLKKLKNGKDYKGKSESKAEKISNETMRQIEYIQWADMRLYNELRPVALKQIYGDDIAADSS